MWIDTRMKKILIMVVACGWFIVSNARNASVDQTIATAVTDAIVADAQQDASAHQTKKQHVAQGKDQTQVIPDLYMIDTIKVIIYSDEGTDIITKSDVDRPSLDGTFRSLDDIVLERLMYLDAKRFKILPDEESIDKHLKAVQRENNLTLDQLKQIFKSAGYTYEEGRQQFAMMTTINSLLDFKIRSRLLVPEREVMAYYKSNPQTEPTRYYIERAVVEYPADEDAKIDLEKDLQAYASSGQGTTIINWSAPFWINEPDLAEDKQPIIVALQKGEISAPLPIEQGYELFKLVDKKEERLVPLEDRYREISNILRKPRYEALMEEYKKQLLDSASIVYF